MAYVAMNERGYPVAVSDNVGVAREFAWHNSGCEAATVLADAPTRWTETGKLYLNDVWTGWEIREVKQL